MFTATIVRQAKKLVINKSVTNIKKSPPLSLKSPLFSTSDRFFHNTTMLRSNKKEDKINEEKPREDALDYPKTKQNVMNFFASVFPFFDKIEPVPCKETIILENIKEYLEQNNPIQIERGCLLKVIHLIDHFNKRQSLFDDPEVKKVLTGEVKISDALIFDDELRNFITSHLCGQNALTEQQKSMIPTDKKFVTDTLGHTLLTDVYISANKLENHFKEKKQPVYTMVMWGQNGYEIGYQLHAIIIFGVTTSNNVIFWDVSDKLPDDIPRIREMDIEEFNSWRNLPPQYAGVIKSGMTRSPIYYYNKE